MQGRGRVGRVGPDAWPRAGGAPPGPRRRRDLCLEQADTLAIVVPATTIRRGWPNHVLLRGPELVLRRPTYAMTEQPRTISRERIVDVAGVVDAQTMAEVDMWLRDFLSLG